MPPALGLLLGLSIAACGCSPPAAAPSSRPDKPPIKSRHRVSELPFDIVVFETVFWEPRDTDSLRQLIHATPLVQDRRVLEIGTGSGLIALCCLHAGAAHVVATDVNPQALENARYNAVMLELDEHLETRLVPLTDRSAFAVIGPTEKFDLIISNPPWEDQTPRSIDEYALYDEGFRLLDSLLRGLPAHLAPGGKCLLAYGNVTAIRAAQRLAAKHDLKLVVLDDRDLDTLEENFLPGMLLEVTPP